VEGSHYEPGSVKILPCEPRDLEQSWEYFRRADLHRLSTPDATSFVIMKRARIHRAYSFDHHFALASFGLCHSLNENGAPAADEDGTYWFAVVRQLSFALQCDIRTRTKLQRSLDSAGRIFYVSRGPVAGSSNLRCLEVR
jgi:hypothetical protein